MVKFSSDDLFRAVRNAQKAGVLELLPQMNGHIVLGDRFFESFQKYLLETFDLEQLDRVLYRCAPLIRYMADESHWKSEEFISDDMFRAVRNLQKLGVFGIMKAKTALPGKGDRYFEYYQRILVEKISVETLDRLVFVLGQCIRFLATDAAMVNM